MTRLSSGLRDWSAMWLQSRSPLFSNQVELFGKMPRAPLFDCENAAVLPMPSHHHSDTPNNLHMLSVCHGPAICISFASVPTPGRICIIQIPLLRFWPQLSFVMGAVHLLVPCVYGKTNIGKADGQRAQPPNLQCVHRPPLPPHTKRNPTFVETNTPWCRFVQV